MAVMAVMPVMAGAGVGVGVGVGAGAGAGARVECCAQVLMGMSADEQPCPVPSGYWTHHALECVLYFAFRRGAQYWSGS